MFSVQSNVPYLNLNHLPAKSTAEEQIFPCLFPTLQHRAPKQRLAPGFGLVGVKLKPSVKIKYQSAIWKLSWHPRHGSRAKRNNAAVRKEHQQDGYSPSEWACYSGKDQILALTRGRLPYQLHTSVYSGELSWLWSNQLPCIREGCSVYMAQINKKTAVK